MESDPREAEMTSGPRYPGAPPWSLARAHDWAATPLGPPEEWPQSLRTAASIVFGSVMPMSIGWGPDLLMLYNDAYAEILGDRGPALGLPAREVWGDEWPLIEPNVARVQGGDTLFFESQPRTIRRDGCDEPVWLTFGYNPILGEGGGIAGVFGAITAISRDAEMEVRVQESEERFRLIADSAPVLMWVTKLDRKRSFANRAYVDFLGITYRDAIDFDWRAILPPDDAERVVAESIAGEATLRSFALEARYRRCDGEWRWMRSVSQPRWGPNGEHAGFIGVAHDITDWKLGAEMLEQKVAERTSDLKLALDRLRAEVEERERAEEALRQAQKMEAVGQLTGGIAHDFNNLLTPVIGGLEILKGGLDEPRLRRIADSALESARRGAKLTGQLLAFSRLQRLTVAPVAVNEVIEGLKVLLTPLIGTSISVQTLLDPEARYALCDSNQLENAILNLAINARDAMPGGGTLTIATGLSVEPPSVDLEPGRYVRVSVTDTGHGMAPDVLARAIEPFFSTKPVGKGTGLGLAQVYGIVRQSNGTLRIDSREGEGTTVTLLLPETAGAHMPGANGRQPDEDEADERLETHSARIAVVDDDPNVRAFLGDALTSLGHRPLLFEGADAALDGLAGEPPDLVLLDFAMPGRNGAELARMLRERHPRLPLVFVTGFADSAQIERALGSAATILKKPFKVDELASSIAAELAAAHS